MHLESNWALEQHLSINVCSVLLYHVLLYLIGCTEAPGRGPLSTLLLSNHRHSLHLNVSKDKLG